MEREILQHDQARAGLQHVQALITNAEELQQVRLQPCKALTIFF